MRNSKPIIPVSISPEDLLGMPSPYRLGAFNIVVCLATPLLTWGQKRCMYTGQLIRGRFPTPAVVKNLISPPFSSSSRLFFRLSLLSVVTVLTLQVLGIISTVFMRYVGVLFPRPTLSPSTRLRANPQVRRSGCFLEWSLCLIQHAFEFMRKRPMYSWLIIPECRVKPQRLADTNEESGLREEPGMTHMPSITDADPTTSQNSCRCRSKKCLLPVTLCT